MRNILQKKNEIADTRAEKKTKKKSQIPPVKINFHGRNLEKKRYANAKVYRVSSEFDQVVRDPMARYCSHGSSHPDIVIYCIKKTLQENKKTKENGN